MRTLILFIACLLISPANGQTSKEVSSEISDVVVYINGAQVTRNATVSIPSGKSDLFFKGITSRLNSNSLQVAAGKNITILSVNHSLDYLEQAKTDTRIEQLTRQRDALQDSIGLKQNARNVFVKEREMLLNNQSIGGNETGVNVQQLILATNFFRERLTEIEESLFANQQTTKKMQERLDKLNRQLNELNVQKDRPTSTLKVSVSAPRSVNAPIQLTYTVRQAKWQPFYDIRVDDTDDPVTLVYKAKVFQNTDENWENVNLTLSTGNPSISNYKPDLNPWFIDFPQQSSHQSFDMEDTEMELSEVVVAKEQKKEPMMIRGTKSLGRENVTTTQQQTTTAFQINIPYTIPSDNQGYDVAVSDHQIEAGFQYATVPKLSPHVYLLAKITEWNDLNLLPGPTNIYFNQTFQGKTLLNPYTSEDTLDVSIGRDPGIIVERELLKDFSSKSFLGSNRKETKAWKITIRNTKNSAANVLVEDQFPVSSNSDIKVDLEESSGAQVNHNTGILNWELDLAPGETKELRMVYSVRYPKDKDLVVE
jgi:uncharacterized protein (TIGR02231 family)